MPMYPLRLDDATAGTEASDETPRFTRVLPEGIRSGWRKDATNEYVYRPEGDRRDREETSYYAPVMRRLRGHLIARPPSRVKCGLSSGEMTPRRGVRRRRLL